MSRAFWMLALAACATLSPARADDGRHMPDRHAARPEPFLRDVRQLVGRLRLVQEPARRLRREMPSDSLRCLRRRLAGRDPLVCHTGCHAGCLQKVRPGSLRCLDASEHSTP